MKNRFFLILSILLLCASFFAPTIAGQIQATPTQAPAVETTPRILDLLGKIHRQYDALRASIDDTTRIITQATGRIAAGSTDDKERALVIVQQAMAKTLVLGKKFCEETALLFEQVDAELATLQREGRPHVEELQHF